MKKNYNRYPIKTKKLYFIKGKHVISESASSFFRRYKVHKAIQLLSQDFNLIKKKTKILTHFNIQYSGHNPGMNYIIVKIKRRGFFDGKIYKQPVYENNNFIIAKCLYVKNNINYCDFKEKFFENSLSNIKNVNALKKFIKSRYKKTLAHFSDKKKLSLGVAITELKIINRAV